MKRVEQFRIQAVGLPDAVTTLLEGVVDALDVELIRVSSISSLADRGGPFPDDIIVAQIGAAQVDGMEMLVWLHRERVAARCLLIQSNDPVLSSLYARFAERLGTIHRALVVEQIENPPDPAEIRFALDRLIAADA